MEVGTDADGRPIAFDQQLLQFSIGGIPATIDRLIAYDRGGQVNWASPEIRTWAYEYEAKRVEYVGEQQVAQAAAASQQAARAGEAARKARLTAQGYDPAAALGLASQLRGLALVLIIGFGINGATLGLVLGVVAGDAVWLLVMPVVFGGGGLLMGYFATLALKAAAHILSSLVQVEMNTRSEESSRLG